jgi:hypothetical protein
MQKASMFSIATKSDIKMMNALSSPNIDQKCCQIIKGLYLGSLKVAVSVDVLKRKGITHIL